MPRFFLVFLILFVLVKSSNGQDTLYVRKDGIFTGLNIATWIPDNKNKILGNPLIMGLTAGIKKSENSYALNFNLIGFFKNGLNEPIAVHFDDSSSFSEKYYAAHLTLEYARQIIRTKRLEIEAVCGLGYGELSFRHPDKAIYIDKMSVIMNPGLSFRYRFGEKFFLQLKAQYCIADYRFEGENNANLKGNYFIPKLIIGSF